MQTITLAACKTPQTAHAAQASLQGLRRLGRRSDAGDNVTKDYVVIARAGLRHGRPVDARVVRFGARIPKLYRIVFGPARRTPCLTWRTAHCDPLPEWRGIEQRIVYLNPPQPTEMTA